MEQKQKEVVYYLGISLARWHCDDELNCELYFSRRFPEVNEAEIAQTLHQDEAVVLEGYVDGREMRVNIRGNNFIQLKVWRDTEFKEITPRLVQRIAALLPEFEFKEVTEQKFELLLKQWIPGEISAVRT